MSWGVFVEVKTAMPRSMWDELLKRSPKDVKVPKDFPAKSAFGKLFRDESWLSDARTFDELIFAKKPVWVGPKCVVTHPNGTRDLRLLVLLDESELGQASLAMALFLAASGRGAPCTLTLVNDGTGPEDQNGWVFTGSRKPGPKRQEIADVWKYVDDFGEALQG